MQMDETPVQVMREPGKENTSNSYMWLARGGAPETPVTLYHYSRSRDGEYARELLWEFDGYLQADGYRVYQMLASEYPGIVRVGCLAHVRRKFYEAGKASKKTGAAHEGLKYISTIYRIERELRSQELDDATFVRRRKEQVEPELKRFHQWLVKKQQTVVTSTLLGKAVTYALGEFEAVSRYLDHAYITPDNNAAERSIKPFVLGRKNWIFSGSPRGANASCTIYSVVETAKQHGLEPFAYLHYVLNRIPKIRHDREWDELLPFNINAEDLNTTFKKPPMAL